MTPVARRRLTLVGAALLAGAAWIGCDLNPQQLPPSGLGDHAGDAATGTTSSGGGSGGMFGPPDAAGAPADAAADGGASQGVSGDGAAGDASEAGDAGDAGEAGDASDGGGAGDGASDCTPDPSSDWQCADAGGTPHLYRCVGPSAQPPAGCQLLSVGNVTDLYCCP